MGDMTAAGEEARHSDAMRAAARVGLVAFGLVHLLIAWIALQVAWGNGGDASSQGALHALAKQPFGEVLLWVSAFGLWALAVWQVMTALWGHQSVFDDKHRTAKRLAALGRAVVYAAVGVSAARTAMGSGGKSQDKKGEGLTADLLSAPAGRALVAAIGVVILVIAVKHVHRGLSDNFTHDLQPQATSGSSGSASCWPDGSDMPARARRSAWSACCSAGPRSRTTPTRPAASTTHSRRFATRRTGRTC